MLRVQKYAYFLCLLVSLSSSLHPQGSPLLASSRLGRNGGWGMLSRSAQLSNSLRLRGGSVKAEEGGETEGGDNSWTPLDADG
eukprot:2094220-Rhodomonas_salina.2